MNKKTVSVFYIFVTLFITLSCEVVYLASQDEHQKDKQNFVRLITLPNLSFFSEDTYARHQVLSDTFSLYNNDSELRDYKLSTYCYKKESHEK